MSKMDIEVCPSGAIIVEKLARGEKWITIEHDGLIEHWKKQGAHVNYVYPTEGTFFCQVPS